MHLIYTKIMLPINRLDQLSKKRRIHLVLMLCVYFFFVSAAHSEEINGYKDLKFGMTAKEAKKTKVVKEGVILFGDKRTIDYVMKKERVVKVRVPLGFHNDKTMAKAFEILKKKYRLDLKPRDIDYDIYNQPWTEVEQYALSWIQGMEIFPDSFPSGRQLVWDFENGHLSFVIGKDIARPKSKMYLVYRNKDLAEKHFKETTKKLRKKTTSDDF